MTTYQLIYSSTAVKKMLKSDLYIILRAARKNNLLNNVTGLLIYSDNKFLQVLEGEKKVVSKIFQTIYKDDRHSDVEILHEGSLEKPEFDNWSMAYVSPSANELAAWAGLHNTTTVEETFDALKSEPNRVSDMLSNILKGKSLV